MKNIVTFLLVTFTALFMSSCENNDLAQPVKVTKITLSESFLTLEAASEAVQLTASIEPKDADKQDVLWSIEGATTPGCVVVNEEGFVSAMAEGCATVVATSADGSMVRAICEVKVTPQIFEVEEIKIPATCAMQVNDVVELEYTVLPERANDKSVEWSIESATPADCLEVDQEGVITAVAEGTATVLVKALDRGGVEARCKVTISPATVWVEEIIIPSTIEMKIGEEDVKINHTVIPSNADVTDVIWSIQSETAHAAISIDEEGNLSAWAEGTTVFVATAADGSDVAASCSVTATKDVILVESITMPETYEIMAGEHIDMPTLMTIEPYNATDKMLYWEVTNVEPMGCGYVDMTGRVWANKMGTLTVWAYTSDGSELSAHCDITILDNTIYVDEIKVEPTMGLVIGEKKSVVVNSVLPEDAWDKTVTYAVATATPEGCFTVDAATGEVTGVSEGTGTVVVTAADGGGATASCEVTVEKGAIPVSSITITPATNVIKQNSTFQYSATVLPSDADDKSVVWSIENASPAGCATISADGNLSAVSIGTATVVATAADGSGVRAESALEVIDDKVILTDITIPTSMKLVAGGTANFSVGFVPADATNTELTFELVDVTPAACVTFDEATMVVSGVAEGTATLRVTTTDGSNISKDCAISVSDGSSSVGYVIGDLYPNASAPVGVVYFVEKGGEHGLVVALNEVPSSAWSTGYSASTANSLVNGLDNTNVIVSTSGWESTFPFFKWVHDELNGGDATYESDATGVWYVPSNVEARQLYAGISGLGWRDDNDGTIVDGAIGDWHNYDNEIWGEDVMTDYTSYESQRDAFNQTIVNAGGTAIEASSYWTSTEPLAFGTPASFYKTSFSMNNGSSNASEFVSTALPARAIMKF